MEIENVFKGMLIALITLVVAVQIGNPQRWNQQFRPVQASAKIPTMRASQFGTRPGRTPLQRVYHATKKRE